MFVYDFLIYNFNKFIEYRIELNEIIILYLTKLLFVK